MAPGEVDGGAKLWKRAGAEVQNFSVWPLGPEPAERGRFGAQQGGCMRRKRNRHQPGSAHGPRGSQSPVDIPCGHPRRWFRFGTFSYEQAQAHGGVLVPAPKGQSSGFPRSGRIQGCMGPERRGPGPPSGPFGRPYSRFGRGLQVNSDPT